MRIFVTDASIVVELIVRFSAEPIEEVLFDQRRYLVAPELLDIEVLHTFRKLESQNVIPESRMSRLLDDFRALRIRRYRHTNLWQGIWNARHNLNAYDACYAVLSHQLHATLITRDQRLARALDNQISVQML